MKFIAWTIYYTMKKALPIFISLCLVISSIPVDIQANSLLAPPGNQKTLNTSLIENGRETKLDRIPDTPQPEKVTIKAIPRISPTKLFLARIRSTAGIIFLTCILFLTTGNIASAKNTPDNLILNYFQSKNIQLDSNSDKEKNSSELSTDDKAMIEKIGFPKEQTVRYIHHQLNINAIFVYSVMQSDIIDKNIGALLKALITINNDFDTQPLQIEITQSGKPLEFDKGLIYHSISDLDRVLTDNGVKGECYFTRFPHEWATGHFMDGSKNPAIFVMDTDIFNQFERNGEARLYIRRFDNSFIVEPYPKIFDGFNFDDIKEIWVTPGDFVRYGAVAFPEKVKDLVEIDKSLLPHKKLIRHLIESKKLKPIPGLARIETPNTSSANAPDGQFKIYLTNFSSIGTHMYLADLFQQVPYLKIKGTSSPFDTLNSERESLIEMVFSDHAKYVKQKKRLPYWQIGYGFLGIFAVGLYFHFVGGQKAIMFKIALKKYDLELAKRLTSRQIAKLLKLRDPSKTAVKLIIGKKGETSNRDLRKIAEIIRCIQSGT